MATPQIRRANRVSAAATRCADDTEATCASTALIDVRALFERAKAILTVADAAAPCIATKLLFHLDLESSGKPTKAKAESTLTALHAAVADAAAPFAHTLPAANSVAGRNLVDTFVTMLQKLATHEAEVFAEAGASSPVVTPAAGAGGGGGGAAPPPMHMPSALTLTSAEDKKNLRIAEAGVYLEKHVPALGQIAPSLIPHKEAILMFDPWTTAAAMPRLPLWKDMTKKLHMQDVVVGRESGVADLICALVAMVHAHAGPMPDGFLASSTDTTMISYQKRTVDPVTHVATVANETRPPCLAAYAVNQAIATIYATAEPLTIEQKNEYAQAFWTCLSTRMTEVTKKSMTRALLAAIEHRDLAPWLSQPREAEAVAAPATEQGGKHRGDRRGGDRGDRRGGDRGDRGDRDGDRRSRSPRDREQRYGDRRSREEKAQRPVCDNWRRDGKCKAHADKKCKDKRHPDMWKNIGEEAYDGGK